MTHTVNSESGSYQPNIKHEAIDNSGPKDNKNSLTEENGIDRRTFFKVGAGLGLLAVCGGGIMKFLMDQESSKGQESGPEIPEEAKDFVEKYGNRYDNPVAVYYAVQKYQEADGSQYDLNVVLDDDYIENFTNNHENLSSIKDGKSELGFCVYKLPKDQAIDQKTNLDIFNNYAIPQINRYMNLLSKNPSSNTTALIDAQFLACCSNTDRLFSDDDEKIKNLVTAAKQIISMYGDGSTSNYSIIPANIANKGEGSLFYDDSSTISSITHTQTNEQLGLIVSPLSELDITFDTYNYISNWYLTKNTKVLLNDFKFSSMQQPTVPGSTFNNISIGLASTPDLSKLKDKSA